MSKVFRRLTFALALAVASLSVMPRTAQANKKLATKMLKDAKSLLKKGKVDSAIERLASAWELVPSAKVGKTLVKAYEKKGDTESAARFIDSVLETKSPRKLVKWAKKKRKVYKKALAKLAKAREEKAAAAVKAEAAAAAERERSAAAAEAKARERKAALSKQKVVAKPAQPPPKKAPAAKAAAAKTAAPKNTPTKDPPAKSAPPKADGAKTAKAEDPDFDEDMESSYVPPPDPTWTFFAWTATGVALTSLGAGTFFLVRKGSRQAEANDCAGDSDASGGRCARATYDSLVSDMDAAFTLELLSWGTALVAAGSAAALFHYAPPAELVSTEGPSWRLFLTPGGGLLRRNF